MRPALPTLLCAFAAAACLALAPAAGADRDRDHGGDRAHSRAYDFHGRDYRGFTPHERDLWRGGRWEQGWHDNRFAWWWISGGGWYLYPTPTYPYPTYVPPAIVVQQPPPMPTGLPPQPFWYYCDNPSGYYPYVAACNGPWRQVPATPTR
jgi:hypothetical protein